MPSWFGSKKNWDRSVEERRALIDPHHELLSIVRQAELLGISRASVYREPLHPTSEDLKLYEALDRLYTAHPFYGQRKLSVALHEEEKIDAGRMRIRTAMGFLGLKTQYPKPNLSRPDHLHRVYPYLLNRVAAGFPNHIWGTDITYIRLTGGFCYLVAIIDWYSRYVIAWKLSPTLESAFCIETLMEALTIATPDFHNSDQGSQFTSNEYLAILESHPEIGISMDGRGRCLDNIFTERLWRTVKYEDVYLKGYATIDEVHSGLAAYFDFYNNRRYHQALGYATPASKYHNTKTLKNETRALGTLSPTTVSTR